MIVVAGTIEVETEQELERVKAALVRRSAKSRADEGNIEYVFSVSIENPKQIRLFEMWESEDLLNAHLMVPDDEFNQMMATAKISSAKIDMHDVATSRELMSR